MVNIFIDPGHGGSDPGATAFGLKEKDICLKIALTLEQLLHPYGGLQTRLSRKRDETMSLQARTQMANRWGADYLVSIHINAGGGTGFESFIHNGSYINKADTNRLRGYVHESIIKTTKFKDRGQKEANFHMLRESNMSAILTENGFIDHPKDAKQLQRDAFLTDIAKAHAHGIANAFNLEKTGSQQPVIKQGETDHLHTVVRGDTLYNLAKQYGTTVVQLIEWNNPIAPEKLRVGQILVVKRDDDNRLSHTIVKSDTLWNLGVRYGTTVDRLLTINPDVDPKRLQIGEQIRIN